MDACGQLEGAELLYLVRRQVLRPQLCPASSLGCSTGAGHSFPAERMERV